MSIKVVDLQNEEAKELPALEPIEEEPKPVETPEVVNEVVEEKNEEPTKEPKEVQKSNLNPNHFHNLWFSAFRATPFIQSKTKSK